MLICEVTLKSYKKTNFSSYLGYCNNIKAYLSDENTFFTQKLFKYININEISNLTEKLFSLDSNLVGIYVLNYFLEEHYLVFEKPVLATNHFYPSLF